MSRCGEFNFALTALDPTQFILKAELHLWLNIDSPPQQDALIVGIQPVHADGRESKAIMRHLEIQTSDSDHYVTFEVNELLKGLVYEGECMFS